MKITFKDIEEGMYSARVSQIQEGSGHYGSFLRIVFTITDGELKHYKFSGFIKPASIKQSKFYKWITNILGEKPDCEFYTEDLIGKECLVSLCKRGKSYIVTEVYQKNGLLYDINMPTCLSADR